MRLTDLQEFIEMTQRHGIPQEAEVHVIINGESGVYEIMGSNVYSSITDTPTLGVKRKAG